MNTLLAITTVVTLVAVAFVLTTVRYLFRGRMLRASGTLAGGIAFAAVGAAGAILLSSLYAYGRLTGEIVVASIEFSEDAPNEFTARLMIDGRLDRFLPLQGDEWQIDARVVTWKAPATILGLDPLYRLERISGRYADIERERTEPRTVHALAEDRTLDIWNLAQDYPALTPGIDAYYGTATYVPMADGARFEVSLSRDALIARPANDAARAAVGNWQRSGT